MGPPAPARQALAEETARAVETIIRNASAQAQIIDELLDVSRIITGKLQLDLQPLDIGAVVQAAIVDRHSGREREGDHGSAHPESGGQLRHGRSRASPAGLLEPALERPQVHGQGRTGPGQHRVAWAPASRSSCPTTESASTPSSCPGCSTGSRRTIRRARGTRRPRPRAVHRASTRRAARRKHPAAEPRTGPGLHLHRPLPAVPDRREPLDPGSIPGRHAGPARGWAGSRWDSRSGRGRRRRRAGVGREGARDPGRHRHRRPPPGRRSISS